MWENLSKFITESPSLGIFKKRYLDFFAVKPNSIFNVHKPTGLKYLTRLSVGFSHLKSHKYNHNFRDTPNPSCACDGTTEETTEHYLLHCPIYHEFRLQLFDVLKAEISIFPLSNSHLTYFYTEIMF